VKQVGRRKSIRPRGRGGGNPADLVPPPATYHRLAPRAGGHETEIQRLLGHKALSMFDRHIEWKSSGSRRRWLSCRAQMRHKSFSRPNGEQKRWTEKVTLRGIR
jgi:hypothetical protein